MNNVYTQSRFTNKTTFTFSSEGVNYTLKDRSGSKSVFLKYEDFVLSSMYSVTERNEYFRNIGFIWLLIGVVDFGARGITNNLWLILGGICLAIYYLVYTKYTIIPNFMQNCLVIHDKQHDEIIEILTKKVREKIIENVGDINFSLTFEQEKKKYNQLHEAGIIDERQFNDYLIEMEASKDKFIKTNQSK